ncbi:MAG: Serine/threonine-protein kinase PK-1 [bacterium ADurb.Bin429]|nr:MAG: Serine/threonine-protein kinase PK-1 [bacterium ADurb.Bin429]
MRCLSCHVDNLPATEVNCPACGAYLPELVKDLLPFQSFLDHDRYQIEYPLGRGSFGVTYRSLLTELSLPVAIKEYFPRDIARRHHDTHDLIASPEYSRVYTRNLRRFTHEGRTLAKLKHPNIVQISNRFSAHNTAYIVMELVTGYSLAVELESQPRKCFSEDRVIEIMNMLVSALSVAHRRGIVHLDIKPANIILESEGRLVLVDFGAARQTVCTDSMSTEFADGVCTPAYAPPELLDGGNAGPESDIFEAGMLLHELLTGTRPPNARLRQRHDDWEPTGVDEPWSTLLRQALRLRQSDRPHDVREWWEGMRNARYQQGLDSIPQHEEEMGGGNKSGNERNAGSAESPQQKSRHALSRTVAFGVLLCVLLAGGYALYRNWGNLTKRAPSPSATAVAVRPPANAAPSVNHNHQEPPAANSSLPADNDISAPPATEDTAQLSSNRMESDVSTPRTAAKASPPKVETAGDPKEDAVEVEPDPKPEERDAPRSLSPRQPAAPRPAVTPLMIEDFQLDRNKQLIRAHGIGVAPANSKGAAARMLARNAALVVAERNLASAVRNTRTTSEDANTTTKIIEGRIDGYTISSEQQLDEHTYEIVLEMPLP